MSWYVGPLSRAEAEALLGPAVPGAFLVRDSRSCPGELALSVAEAPAPGHQHHHQHHDQHHEHQQQQQRTARISHYIINRAGGELRMGDRRFGSLEELVEHYRRHRLDTTTLLVPGAGGAGGDAGGGGGGGGSNTQEVAERRARSECSGSGTLRRRGKARPHRSAAAAANNNNHQHHHQQQQQQQHDHNDDHASSSSAAAAVLDERQACGPPRGLGECDRGRDNGAWPGGGGGVGVGVGVGVGPEAIDRLASVSRKQATLPRRSRCHSGGGGGGGGIAAGAGPGRLVRALYDFDGKDAEDLAFRRGETLTVVSAPAPAQGQWWTAANDRGRVGQIPMNYVELLPPPPPRGTGSTADAVRPRGEEEEEEEEEEGARRRRGGVGGGGVGGGGVGGGAGAGAVGGGLLGVRVPVLARVVQDRTPTPYDTSALRLKVGEVVKVVRVDVSGQWEGEVAGRRGFFPFTHVQLLAGPR
ncbi:crk-like protein [Petromyzon marinus]|uniref:crk-like protein n=1 Tax=Petromyzon marinus TaxID=7757 RepID=UPI003F72F82F